MMPTIMAYVGRIDGNRAGHLSETVRISADYEASNIAGSITFDVPVSEAREYYIGQKLRIEILPVKWEE